MRLRLSSYLTTERAQSASPFLLASSRAPRPWAAPKPDSPDPQPRRRDFTKAKTQRLGTTLIVGHENSIGRSVLTAESLRHTFRMRPHAEQPRVSSGKKNPKGFWNTNKHHQNGIDHPLYRENKGIGTTNLP